MIFAPGSEGAATVCQAEAELLFRLKDAALYEPNAPEWQELFVQGVANYLLGFSGPETLNSERAAELEAFMNAEGAGIGGFISRMMTSDVEDGFGSLLGDADPDSFDWQAEAQAGAELEPAEADWLRDQLDADEELDDYEKALIVFIDAETGESFVPRP